jgi:E3 ubiquitin-protein ligase TRIP12
VDELSSEDCLLFECIGWTIARGLYDDRLLDFPLSSLFWDAVLDRPLTVDRLMNVDKDLGKALIKLNAIVEEKCKIKNSKNDLNELIKYNGARIEDIGLVFTLPGYHIELKRGGSDTLVTVHNIEEYVHLLHEKLFKSGIRMAVQSFKKGFNMVFGVESLKCFTSKELEELICGSDSECWDYNTLSENIIPLHGYDKSSNTYTSLLKVLSDFDRTERKMFLLFVTGCQRLPLGGKKLINF